MEATEAVAKIRITKVHGKTRRKILDTFSGKNISLDFVTDLINCENRKYVLKNPLRCLFEKEDDYFIIQSELLGIIGTGRTQEEAEKSFSLEFDFLYNRLQTLQNEQLTHHNQLIKNIIREMVVNIQK